MQVLGFAGFSGSGKTTLIEQLIPRLTDLGLRVSLLKHAHHRFDIDQPGKDSHRHRQAGASEVLISSGHRWVLMHELRGAPEPDLQRHLQRLSPCDLVLVEGYKRMPIPKIEVHRTVLGQPLLFPEDPHIVALATDRPAASDCPIPCLDLNSPDKIADYIRLHHLPPRHEPAASQS